MGLLHDSHASFLQAMCQYSRLSGMSKSSKLIY